MSYFDCREVAWHETADCSQIFEHTYTCNDSIVTNIMAYRIKESEEFRMLCDGLAWDYYNGTLAVNVDNSTSQSWRARCTAEPNKGVIPATVACQEVVEDTNQFNITKFTAVLTMRQEVIVADSVPRIDSLTVTPLSTNVSVVINATCFDPYCTFYCGALPANATLTSARALVAYGTALVSVTSNTNEKHYSLHSVTTANNDLIPGDYYDVYCYAEDSIGNGASLDMVKATKKVVLTSCCKPITWSNSPSYLYAATSKYDGKDSSTYTFTYSLIEAPEDDLFVEYRLYKLLGNSSSGWGTSYDGGSAANATLSTMHLSPQNATFTSASVPRSDTGFVGASLTVTCDFVDTSGWFSIVLVTSGTNSAEFATMSTEFQLLSAYEEPVAPTLRSAIFSSNGAYMDVIFNSETDYAAGSTDSTLSASATSTGWDCSLLLTMSGSTLSTCQWISSTEVRVIFPVTSATVNTAALIVPGGTVTLVSGVLKAACSDAVSECSAYAYASSSSVTSEANASPESPTIVWNLPIVIGNCDNLTLDATGSYGNGGREWARIAYTLTATSNEGDDAGSDTTVSTIKSLYLDNLNDTATTTEIPGFYFNTSLTYYFKLELENYYGSSGTSTVEILRDRSSSIPSISMVGSNDRTMNNGDALTLMVTGKVSACSDDVSLSYQWYIYQDTAYITSLSSSSNDPRKMTLDAYSLAVGSSYRFTVIVTTNSGQRANTSCDVLVESGLIHSVIAGGSMRNLPVDKAFTLDGSGSYDDDVQLSLYANSMDSYPLTYAWSCVYGSMTRYGVRCDAETFGASGVSAGSRTVNIAANTLVYNETYIFTLECASTLGGNRTGSSIVKVKAVAGGAPSVSIASTAYSSGATTKFSSFDRITLTGNIEAEGDLTGTWSVSPEPLTSLSGAGLIATSRRISAAQAGVSGGYAQQFAISGAHFVPGATYTFRLTAVLSRSLVHSYAEVEIKANSPPVVGSVSVSPSSGTALTTSFKVSAANFIDDSEDLPLQYRFVYAKYPDIYAYGPLNSFSERSYVQTMLPMGYKPYDYRVVCTAVVKDIHGAKSNASTDPVEVTSIVVVSTPSSDTDSGDDQSLSKDTQTTISTALETSMTSSLASGDADTAQQVISVVADVLNGAIDCSGAPTSSECNATYNRNGCTDVPHTCGGCLDGYIGISGSSNTRCRSSTSSRRRLEDTGSFSLASSTVTDESDYLDTYSTCESDDDCGWGSCETGGTCTPFYKTCPSASSSEECSGKGQCVFLEASGHPVTSCLATNPYCEATCWCVDGYAGPDCGITEVDFAGTEAIRGSLCVALTNTTSMQDRSGDMLESSSLSLSEILKAEEMVSQSVVENCLTTLSTVSTIAGEGYLAGSSAAVGNIVASLSELIDLARLAQVKTVYEYWNGKYNVSSYPTSQPTTNVVSSFSRTSGSLHGRRMQTTSTPTGQPTGQPTSAPTQPTSIPTSAPSSEVDIRWNWDEAAFIEFAGEFRHHLASTSSAYDYLGFNQTITSLIESVHADMLPGESQRDFVSDNLRLSVLYPLLADLPSASISVPLSSDDVLYGIVAPTLTFPSTGLDACYINNTEYVQLSWMAWGFAPYSNR